MWLQLVTIVKNIKNSHAIFSMLKDHEMIQRVGINTVSHQLNIVTFRSTLDAHNVSHTPS